MAKDILLYLKKHYPNNEIQLIGSGKASDAYQVGDKIIRVPKAGLEPYEKEVLLLDFLQSKLPCPIPHPVLIQKNGLIYAKHTKIEGNAWDISTYNALPTPKQDLFAQDIANFLAALHSIPVCEIYQHVPKEQLKPYTLEPLQKFKTGLATSFTQKEITLLYNYGKKTLSLTSAPVLVHKDFWEGNILVDKAHRLCGVLDWGTASVCDREWDFRSLYSPEYMPLFKKVANFYQQKTGYTINKKRIQNLKTAGSILSIQYFLENPDLKNTATFLYQKTITNLQKALIQINTYPSKTWHNKELTEG